MTVARRHQPDAVLLRNRDTDGGIAAVRRLRSSVYTAAISVICVAAAGGAEKETLLAAGVQEMIDAPGDPSAIDEALRWRTIAARPRDPADELDLPVGSG